VQREIVCKRVQQIRRSGAGKPGHRPT
jgi:hypothetical protein